jgi:hypothetical protein
MGSQQTKHVELYNGDLNHVGQLMTLVGKPV